MWSLTSGVESNLCCVPSFVAVVTEDHEGANGSSCIKAVVTQRFGSLTSGVFHRLQQSLPRMTQELMAAVVARLCY